MSETLERWNAVILQILLCHRIEHVVLYTRALARTFLFIVVSELGIVVSLTLSSVVERSSKIYKPAQGAVSFIKSTNYHFKEINLRDLLLIEEYCPSAP